MKRLSALLLVGIFAALITAIYVGFVFWQKASSEADQKKLEKVLSDLNQEVLEFENKQVVQAVNAKQIVDALKSDMKKWSTIIKRIRATLPKADNKLLVEALSYSGSLDGGISMNFKTASGSENPYFDVASLIKSFDDSNYFTESFVPSISSGTDEEGWEILSFLMTTKYVEAKKKSEGDLEKAVGEILNESLNN
ncbi:hypothetical protein A3B60_03180 [Candidatus Peregrinibacteria bacterium RIFCSPLOWO2_01_FULL_39_12]|nr:MAG: hypothetical protein A3B60_03180 [Candidatus Peregrinibacteria bacterium RIFCSPLOWO2_01_FULL_39_12]